MAIQLKRSATPSSAPQSLAAGELAINTYDARVFWADHLSVVRSFTFRDYALASHSHDASAITSGTVASARLGTGTASASTYLRGDGAWAAIDAPTTTGAGASGTWQINVSGELTGTRVGLGYTLAAATVAYGGHAGPQIRGQGGGAAAISFHRPGAYAVNFGLDTDNQLKIGGWSLGETSYVILSSGNYNSYAPTLTGGGASGTWAISVTGNAGYATYSTYQSGTGTANNFNTNFNETPAHNRAFREMSAGGPQGAWWFVENLRHSNASNQWGRQNAWGWEDNANELWSRNVQAGNWGSWVRFLHSGNYNSYAPTLTGVGASGTWGISVTGTAGSETLATVCSRGLNASAYGPTFNTVYTDNWFRSNGNSGWYSQTHGGGIWMTDSTWVRVYNNKQFYADNYIESGSSVRAPIFYDSQDTAYYCDPNGTSRLNAIDCNSFVMRGTNFYVGDGVTYTYIHMRDSDNGERLIHCNSDRIGFLNQAGGWSAWSYDNGTWGCYGGTEIAVEAIGGWGRYGATIEARTDSNGAGTQDGPKIFFHKAGAKFWAAGIQPYGAHGFAIWEDGSSIGWGTERLTIGVGGTVTMGATAITAAGDVTNKSRPAFFVRAWITMSGGNPVTTQASGNVSSVSFLNTGRYELNFATPIPSSSALIGTCSNGDVNTLLNTCVRAGAATVGGIGGVSGILKYSFSTIQSGGQGVPGFTNLSSTHVALIG